MEFVCRGTPEGLLEFGAYNRARFKQYLKDNGPVRLIITPDLPESAKLRRFYEGAVVPLIAFYQEGMDHRSGEDRRKVREWLKEEFNGEMVEIGGKVHTVAKSTKGRAVLNPFVERVIDWLHENYDPPAEALDPEKFKHWRDTVFPYGGPETYMDYLVELNILKPYGSNQ
jgi:hypothetical protein